MKRIVTASILAVALLLCGTCLFACSPDEEEVPGIEYVATVTGKTPEQLYSEVQTSLEALNQGSTKVVVAQDVTVMGMTFHQEVTNITDGADSMGTLTTEADPSMNFTFVLVDGIAYYHYPNNNNLKIKGELDLAKAEEQLGYQNSSLLDIPEEWFDGLQFIKVNDNSFCLSFVVSGDYFESMFGELFATMGVTLNSLQDLKYEVYFDANGEFVCMDTLFSYVAEGYTFSVVQRTTVEEFTGTITVPSDASSYRNFDFSQIFG